MRTPLAIYNLLHAGAKTLVSISGVAFALLLVFMQLGFMGAVSYTATNTLNQLQFDVMLRGKEYIHLYEPGSIDARWLDVASSTAGIEAAYPVWVTVQNWRQLTRPSSEPAMPEQRRFLPVAVLAFRPGDPVFLTALLRERLTAGRLGSGRRILVDDSTRADYGPWDGRSFGEQDVGRPVEIGQQQFDIVGTYQLGTGLAANGAVLMTQSSFQKIVPYDTADNAAFVLLSLDADSDPRATVERLEQRLRSGAIEPAIAAIDVLTRGEVLEREKQRWLWQTPIGLIFQLGVLLSLFVGAAIVYMVLSTDVANRLPEYATLLAIGYSRIYLASLVMTQALVLGLLGFAAAWVAAELMYKLTYQLSGIPLENTLARAGLVIGLGLAMCGLSGLLALRKLWKAEPANLF